MKVLITYAVEAEIAPWRRGRDLEKVQIGGVEVHRAQVGRATVDFVVTGMGEVNAQRVSEAIMTSEYSLCIAAGFAGALRPAFKAGDIVVAEKVQPQAPRKPLECSRNLLMSATSDGATRIATLVTACQVIRSASEKESLASYGEAVDMESVAILEVARVKKVPAVAIRVISDSFRQDLPINVDTLVDEQGNVKIGGVARYVARHPLSLAALVRLGRGSRTAAEALAHFLEAYIKKLSFASQGWPLPELRKVATS